MPYVYADVEKLEGQPLVGSHHCVAMVREYAKAPPASTWKQGEIVKGNTTLKKGTTIATFVDGVYPNYKTGNHAALYISQDSTGIRVMDQWRGDPKKPTISSRVLRFKGFANGKPVAPLSNNGDAYCVVD